MIRMDLPDGQWVDLVPRANYAQFRRIGAASGQAQLTAGVAALVTNWSLCDVYGRPIPFPADRLTFEGLPDDALDLVPADVILEIAATAAAIATGKPIPKAEGKPSPSSSQGEPESLPSMTNSQTHSSSPTTRAGRGKTSSGHLPT